MYIDEETTGCVGSLIRSFKNLFSRKARYTVIKSVSIPKNTFLPKSLKFIKVLGQGGFGKVFLAQKVEENSEFELCAVKRLQKHPLIVQKQVDHIISENKLLASVNHPFIVKHLGSYKDNHYLYLVMEYVSSGDFFTYLRKENYLESHDAMFYAAQVTAMFEYLHDNNIIYRDLKPENLLLCFDGYLKLTDFGFAKVVEFRTYTLCGTPEYMSPEIILHLGYGKAVDWWTLGILIYEMLAGYPPFYDSNPQSLYDKILKCKLKFPIHYDEDAKYLTSRLLVTEPSQRFGNLHKGIDDIKKCKWFESMDFDALVEKELSPPHIPERKEDLPAEEFIDSYRMPKEVTGEDDPFVDW
ncbi:cAMP-dependent protein kinase catalytic subunit, putative [Theileria annulata]|uniref:cAMP-dependent protein kinase catalytic subunit, putative n=1 Tax=Theileria annulata TaxID=5874 RepID=Q4UE84_THEAN|nr:cAMP-dependent protein kinase catalytic subunit, putative [Theileria annulata]CAI74605.1 cAMP-dependent protein kinase catalytic subunit, putative [Theileria annulata]|eukprot:XP_952337.1 cAMP-dependent protein kinase catalytic subunit, putative [Theileria annulata]